VIYFDYNASTPIDPTVAAVMGPLLEGRYGNPAARHRARSVARTAIEAGREQVAGLLGCEPDEVVFTSGGSEANNLAIKDLFLRHFGRPAHITTSQIEHPAVLEPCRAGSSIWSAARFRSAGELRRLLAGAELKVGDVRGAAFFPPVAPWPALGRASILGWDN
jgi:Aminotransferase class-V